MNCPKCHSTHLVKHGRTHYAKERLPGVSSAVRGESTRDPIADESRELIDKLLQERLALAGIARVTGCVSAGCKCISTRSTIKLLGRWKFLKKKREAHYYSG